MNLAGLFAPIPTPFDERDQVDLARLRRALTRWLSTELTGLVILGSNGEAALLDEDESDRVVALAREITPPDRPLIVGTGRESTRATIAASKRAGALGADAVLVRTPGFFKAQMTSDLFIHHYTAVADASPVPVLLYNFTAVTGVNLIPAAVAQLSGHPNIVGVKESSGDIAQISELVNQTPAGFGVLAGSATTFYPALAVGAVGGILALAAIVPDACVRLFELTRRGLHEDARALQRQMVPLARLATSLYGVAGLKAALNLLGYDVGAPRPPLLPLSEAGVGAVREALTIFQEAVA